MSHNTSPGRRRRKARRAAQKIADSAVNRPECVVTPSSATSSDLAVKSVEKTSDKPFQKSASESTGKNGKNEITEGDGKSFILVLGEVLGSIVFAALAQMFFSTGRLFLGICCTFAGCGMAGLILVHYLSIWCSQRKKLIWWSYGIILCTLSIPFGFWAFRVTAKIDMKPHLSLKVDTLISPGLKLPLTNDFLYCKPHFTFPLDTRGALVVPLSAPGYSNVVLKFSVWNNNSAETARSVDVRYRIRRDLDFIPIPTDSDSIFRWVATDQPEPDDVMEVAMLNLDLKPGMGAMCGSFDFHPSAYLLENRLPSLFIISIQADGLEPVNMAFGLFFVPIPNITATNPFIQYVPKGQGELNLHFKLK